MKTAAMKDTNPQRRAADVDIAVLQVQYANIEEKVSDLKDGLKDLREVITSSQQMVSKEIATLSAKHDSAHKALSIKISSLEKWRWVIVTSAMVVGTILWNVATHWDMIVKFMK
jgi:hypothetical protein